MIPHNFDEWRSCIENDCKVKLTKDFATQRLAVYENSKKPETLKFKSLYGVNHLNNVIRWYKQIQ